MFCYFDRYCDRPSLHRCLTCADEEQLHQLDVRQPVAQRRGGIAQQVPPQLLQLRQCQVEARLRVVDPVHVVRRLHQKQADA